MKSLRLFAVLLALFATACASQKVIEGDDLRSQTANAIAQAQLNLLKGYRFVADQAAVGILLKSEVEDALGILDKAKALVDDAHKLYKLGNFQDALGSVQNADRAMAFVEAEIAKRLKARRKETRL